MEVASMVFLTMYSRMHEKAVQAGDYLLWHHFPKLHAWQHVVGDARSSYENPRFSTCFSGEDFVGAMINLSAASHATTVAASTIASYILGVKQRVQFFETGDESA